MNFYPEFEKLNLEELIAIFKGNIPETEDSADVYYSELASLIREKGEEGIAFLKSKIKRADSERLRAMMFALTEPPLEDSELRNLLLSYLQDKRETIVAEAIDSLCRQGEKDTLNQVLPMVKHQSPYVRGSTLRFLARLYPERAFPLLVEALKDPSFIVRENAADELGELGEIKAIPYLRPFLADANADVREAASSAIALLEA